MSGRGSAGGAFLLIAVKSVVLRHVCTRGQGRRALHYIPRDPAQGCMWRLQCSWGSVEAAMGVGEGQVWHEGGVMGTPPEISRGVEVTASICLWGSPSAPDSKPPGLGVQTPGWDGQAGGKGPQSPCVQLAERLVAFPPACCALRPWASRPPRSSAGPELSLGSGPGLLAFSSGHREDSKA